MEANRFLLSGSGGQGVITMGILLAEAAVMHEGLTAVQAQSYGPEARGGATRCDVIISRDPILFPKVLQANVLVSLTQEALQKYIQHLSPGGLLVTDDSVQPNGRVNARHVSLPMHERVMGEIGKAQVYNICVLGAVIALTGAVKRQSLEKLLKDRFAAAFHEANNNALDLGMQLAKACTA